jgi:hypothetical protein
MTHNEKRSHWVREGAISLGTGILYGVTVVGTAHVKSLLLFIFQNKIKNITFNSLMIQ